jgi:hypothetical protein
VFSIRYTGIARWYGHSGFLTGILRMRLTRSTFGDWEHAGTAKTALTVLSSFYIVIISTTDVQDSQAVEECIHRHETKALLLCTTALETATMCLKGIDVQKDEKEVRRVDFGPMLEQGQCCLLCLRSVNRGEKMQQEVEQFARILVAAEKRCDACCQRDPTKPIAPKCAKKDRMYLVVVIAQFSKCMLLLSDTPFPNDHV